MPKPLLRVKYLTFVYLDRERNTSNTVEWKTSRRTVAEAWEDCRAFVARRCGVELVAGEKSLAYLLAIQRFEKIHVFEGLCKAWDENKPLRRPTKEELEQLTSAAS